MRSIWQHSLEEWLEYEDSRDLVSLLHNHLDCFSTEPNRTNE
ncbi:hypothetical protein [Paenibacillus chitinolyticus]|nr:hypothetical protein [Paenibacillus chitinolyticus]